MNILIAAGVVGIIGLFLGLAVGIVLLFFSVEKDSRIDEILEVLPGANCGGCGFAGCGDLARAIVEKGVDPCCCSACGAEQVKRIGEILGKELKAREKEVAVVYCSGSLSLAPRSAAYNGLNDCRAAANLGGGGKGCRYGCIGLASCARVCPFGAIEMRDGLAIVHPEICTGCGKCMEVCPRKLIRLVPASFKAHIYCNSLDKPVEKRKHCKIACFGCKKCVKADPEKFNSVGSLVRVVDGDIDGELLEKINCPAKVLQSVESHVEISMTEKAKKEDGKNA